jgi:hypothetical protein
MPHSSAGAKEIRHAVEEAASSLTMSDLERCFEHSPFPEHEWYDHAERILGKEVNDLDAIPSDVKFRAGLDAWMACTEEMAIRIFLNSSAMHVQTASITCPTCREMFQIAMSSWHCDVEDKPEEFDEISTLNEHRIGENSKSDLERIAGAQAEGLETKDSLRGKIRDLLDQIAKLKQSLSEAEQINHTARNLGITITRDYGTDQFPSAVRRLLSHVVR